MIRASVALIAASVLGFLAQFDFEQWSRAPAWVAFCAVCVYAIRAVYADLRSYRKADREELQACRASNSQLLAQNADLRAELRELKGDPQSHAD